MADLKVRSPEFKDNEHMPERFTCDGDGISPPIEIGNVPKGAKSLALIVDDPDAPSGTYVHWVVWNIPPSTTNIEEGKPPGKEGANSSGDMSYTGPCPPSGTHRYFFKVYALDTELDIDEDSNKEDVEDAMDGHVLASGQTIGLYSRRTT
jgi:Raf kinase inhibitor-like YbhB/YbcL family protein